MISPGLTPPAWSRCGRMCSSGACRGIALTLQPPAAARAQTLMQRGQVSALTRSLERRVGEAGGAMARAVSVVVIA